MINRIIILIGVLIGVTFVQAQQTTVKTYSNPLNISYRFF